MTPEPSYRAMLSEDTRHRLDEARKARLRAARNAWRQILALVPPSAWHQVTETVIAIAAERSPKHDTMVLCADLATLGVPYRLWGRYLELRDGYEKGEMS